MENRISILCTRPVSQEQLDEAATNSIDVDVLSFIEIAPIETVEVQQEIESALLRPTSVVFTSMNAVEAVSIFIDEQPGWKIYCMGNTTRLLAEKYFGEAAIAGTAQDATSLAELIVAEGESDSVIFFCGDQRRDELPAILNASDIEVEEVVVYETVPVPHKIKKEYLGILFFSPSAVESFFSVNKIAPETKMFAIGKTTADAIAERCNNKILLPEQATKYSLVEKMLEYFSGY
ncbi:MAG: uroporphyrinogen-III synthase [Ferruginibacter sp.]